MLDVSVNKPFKNYITKEFLSWQVSTGKKTPTRQDLAHWIDVSWKKILNSTIENGWRKCGLELMKTGDEQGGETGSDVPSDDDPLLGPLDVIDNFSNSINENSSNEKSWNSDETSSNEDVITEDDEDNTDDDNSTTSTNTKQQVLFPQSMKSIIKY